MKNILFVFGGRSCESDVSVLTGLLAMSAADGEKYNAVPLYISASGEFFTGDKLKSLETFKNADGDFSKVAVKATFVPPDKAVYTIRKGKLIRGDVISAIVNCCHGGAGEDGSLSGYFVFFGVPVCSPGVFAGAVSMDKAATKTFLKAIGVLTPDFIKVPAIEDREEAVKTVKKRLGYPAIVKPLTLGSSVGIGVALNEAELNKRMNYAYRFDDTVIVEEYLAGAEEFNCAAYKKDGKVVVSECERPVFKGNILSFDDKYLCGKREFPAKIKKELSDKIKAVTLKVYDALSFTGIIRIDYLYHSGKLYLNEINSVPGSLALYLFSEDPKNFRTVITDIIEEGEREFNRKNSAVKSIKTGIFSSSGSKGSKGAKR